MGTRGTNDADSGHTVHTEDDHRDTGGFCSTKILRERFSVGNHEHLGPAVRSSMKVWWFGEEKYVFSGSYLYVPVCC